METLTLQGSDSDFLSFEGVDAAGLTQQRISKVHLCRGAAGQRVRLKLGLRPLTNCLLKLMLDALHIQVLHPQVLEENQST